MKTDMDALILKDLTVGDKDRIVTVLTKEKGVISCFVRGASNIRHPNFAPTRPLTFSRLSIYKGRGMYIIDEASTIRSFYSFGLELDKLALAQYMCELIIKTTPQDVYVEGQLELVLNCLHMLMQGSKPDEIIKTVFELRLAVLWGNMPNLLYCADCGKYESDPMYFNYEENLLKCCSCCDGSGTVAPLSKGALTALRYIVLADPKKIFSFLISQQATEQLSSCSEKYVTHLVGGTLKTLDYYHMVRELG